MMAHRNTNYLLKWTHHAVLPGLPRLWWDPPAPPAGGEGGWCFSVQSSTAAVTDVGVLPLLIISSH